MDSDEIVKKLIDEISDDIKEDAEEVKKSIKYWGEVIVKLRLKKIAAKDDELKALEKDEDYAWAAISSLKAKYAQVIEEKSWVIIEKVLTLLRKVLLS